MYNVYVSKKEVIEYFENLDFELHVNSVEEIKKIKGDKLSLQDLQRVLKDNFNEKKSNEILRKMEGEVVIHTDLDLEPDVEELRMEALSEEDLQKMSELDLEDDYFDGDNVSF